MKKVIYLDIDDVLVDMHGMLDTTLLQLFPGIVIHSEEYSYRRYSVDSNTKEYSLDDIYFECKKLLSNFDFIYSLPLFTYTKKMLDLIVSYNTEIVLLTAPSVSKEVQNSTWKNILNAKLAWAKDCSVLSDFNINGIIVVNTVKNKSLYTSDNSILIDDLESNCYAFGNNSIVFPATWNEFGKYIITDDDKLEYIKIALEVIR